MLLAHTCILYDLHRTTLLHMKLAQIRFSPRDLNLSRWLVPFRKWSNRVKSVKVAWLYMLVWPWAPAGWFSGEVHTMILEQYTKTFLKGCKCQIFSVHNDIFQLRECQYQRHFLWAEVKISKFSTIFKGFQQKLLGCFSWKQHIALSFSNTRGCKCTPLHPPCGRPWVCQRS